MKPTLSSSRCLGIALTLALLAGPSTLEAAESDGLLRFEVRKRVPASENAGKSKVVSEKVTWKAEETAVVVCDMWDQHWCQGATARVAEMAPRMNETLRALRERGALIIHAPSNTLDFYKDTPQRKRAQEAPKVETDIPLQRWCAIDDEREGPLPIDDSDGGCDCTPQCEQGKAWSRQISTIDIMPEDAITDSAEAYYLMKQQGIENVLVMGVHTNMCVLGRPFSIRQMRYQGQNVVLVRDLTDTMYNSKMRPFVSHFVGTDLVVEHIERYWAPTVTSDAFLGGAAFHFQADGRFKTPE
jgi:nicotinamidase-related amidase